jgi:hypothetical protein
MRDQYVGDISDLLKLAFLRKLAKDDGMLGVGWCYNPTHDGSRDGRHREYLDERRWASLDATVWSVLKQLPEQSVAALERLTIWPANTIFHRTPMPTYRNRQAWTDEMKGILRDADIIFLDPDNGLGRATERHVTPAEVAAIRCPGRAVVLIKFPGRQEHARQIQQYHNLLRGSAGASSIATVCTCVWIKQPRCRWFTIIDGDQTLIGRAKHFAKLLNGIERCSADLVCEPSSSGKLADRVTAGDPSTQELRRLPAAMSDRTGPDRKVCPECGHEFKGAGFDGIDAHWRAKHEAIMPYRKAWPLVKAGVYRC